jgi:hypothetical protein
MEHPALLPGKGGGSSAAIPLKPNSRLDPDFLYAAPSNGSAAFIEESRMKFTNANKLHRKSGKWGTHGPVAPEKSQAER